jgi:hypothetical protein
MIPIALQGLVTTNPTPNVVIACFVGVIALRATESHPTVARVGTTKSKKMKVLAGIVLKALRVMRY